MWLQRCSVILSLGAGLVGTLVSCAPSPALAQSTPVAHWTFDEGSGLTAASRPGTAAGTLTGDAAWSKDAKVGTGALLLSGHGNVDVPQPVVDTRQSFTVSAWVKLNRVSGYQTFVSIDGGTVSGFYLQLLNSGTFGLTMLPSDGPGDAAVATGSLPVDPGVWYQIIGVHDAAAHTVSLYVNGALQQSLPFTSPWQATGHTEIGRGKYNGQPGDFVDGEIDDVRIYAGVVLDKAQMAALAAQTKQPDLAMTIDLSQTGPRISPLLYGLMIEDISHSIDGGLYAELIQNRALKDDPNQPAHWSLVPNGGAGTLSLDTTQPVPNTTLTNSLRLDITAAGQGVGAANDGYWGIPVRPQTTYPASFYAKASAGYKGALTASLQSADGGTTLAAATVPGLTTQWKKYTLSLTTTGNATPTAGNRFVVSAHGVGSVWLTQLSLMPPTYHGRSNGSRIDLMDKLAAMHPSFLRMPGGNYLEGNTIAERFDWKKTVGDISQRPGHQDPWGYRSSDGYGLLEYFNWCDDLHMPTVLAVFAGYALGGEYVPAGPQLAPYVQDALDEIEYATGGPTTKWGAVRVKSGHPAPFTVPYVEVGNEDWADRSGSYAGRFAQFTDAIRAKYPQIKIIASTGVNSRRPDVVDEHFYRSARDFERDTHHYDNYDRSAPKVFVGEYASQEGNPTPNLSSALGDAAFMTGMERNADVIVLASYAPLLVNINPGASQWGTNLIGFDALNSYVSPAYYTQQLFSLYHGDTVVPTTLNSRLLACSVSKVTATGTVYVKVVNPSGAPQTVTLTVAGAKTIAPVGTTIVLSSASLSDTNTIAEPNKIVPVQSTLTGVSPQFSHVFPPYSLTVLKLQVH